MDQLITITQKALIECNFGEIKKHLEEQLSLYSNMIFTEESKKDAKNTVADLRKEKKLFTDRVKEIRAEYMKPYEEFFEKASEISDMYDKPIAFINEQIEAFEAKRIEEKKIRIGEIYEELVEEEWHELLPFKRIYSTRWENATYSEKQIKEDILDAKADMKDAIATIKLMKSEKEAEAIKMYTEGFDLKACLSMISNYEEQKREIEARVREAEEQRIRAEERAKMEAEQRLVQAQEEARKEAIDNLIPEDVEGAPEAIYTYDIKLTAMQKEALEIYMNSVGISFELMELPM